MYSPIVFDKYQRYHFIQHVISLISKSNNCSILEVGALGSPLQELLPEHRILKVDSDPKAPEIDLRATGLHLPFLDQAFEIVVSTDALEHMTSTDRIPFIKELVRVASAYLILGFPHADPLNTEADRVFFEFMRNYSGLNFDYLNEHLKYGLPDADEIHSQVQSLLPDVLEFKNANIHSWILFQLGNFILSQHPELQTVQTLLNDFFNRSLEAFSHRPPNYRAFLIGSRRPFASEVKAQIEQGSDVALNGPAEEFAAKSFAFISASQAAIRQKKDELELEKSKLLSAESKLQIQEEQLKKQELDIENLQASLQNHKLTILNLQSYLNLFLRHPAYKVFKFLKNSLHSFLMK